MSELFRIPIRHDLAGFRWMVGRRNFCTDAELRRQFKELPYDLTHADLVAYTHPGQARFSCQVIDYWGPAVEAGGIESCFGYPVPHTFWQPMILRVLKRLGLGLGSKFYVQVEY